MTTVIISLPEFLKAFIGRQLATGEYGNVTEYLRSLLRVAQQAEVDARLEALPIKGLTGGEDIAVTPEFRKELKVEARILPQSTRRGSAREFVHRPAGARRHHPANSLVSGRAGRARSCVPVSRRR
jgi:antitoxin ParD1/3/4